MFEMVLILNRLSDKIRNWKALGDYPPSDHRYRDISSFTDHIQRYKLFRNNSEFQKIPIEISTELNSLYHFKYRWKQKPVKVLKRMQKCS